MPSGVAEFPGAHDLGADAGGELSRECIVDAARPAALAEPLAAPAGREHPLVQPFAGVTERPLSALALTGAEAIKRNGKG